MAGGDGGGVRAEDGGSASWLPIFDRLEAMVSRSQAEAEALAADRARLEAANRMQRESWEAARRLQRSVEELQVAAQEKDAELDRLRAEAANAKKKLQVIRSRPSSFRSSLSLFSS
jgi:predicted RNase H-like nuclease (RuvC/YqgF family)